MLDRIVKELIKKETLERDEFERLFEGHPGVPKKVHATRAEKTAAEMKASEKETAEKAKTHERA